MKIQSISNSKFSYATQVSSQKQRKSPNFQATLTVCEGAKRAITGESLQRFNYVMEKFGKELKNSKLAPYGSVYIDAPNREVLIDTKYGKEKANLLLSGFNREVNFFYNIQSTTSEIIEDLCKSFEYLFFYGH